MKRCRIPQFVRDVFTIGQPAPTAFPMETY